MFKLPPSFLPEQVAAHTDDRVSGGIQTNVALERRSLALALALPVGAAVAAAARSVAVVASTTNCKSSSAGRPRVTGGPGTRSRHSVWCTSAEVDAAQAEQHATTRPRLILATSKGYGGKCHKSESAAVAQTWGTTSASRKNRRRGPPKDYSCAQFSSI